MDAAERLRGSAMEVIIAGAFTWMLLAVLGLPPIALAIQFFSGAWPTGATANAVVDTTLWLAALLMVIYSIGSLLVGSADELRRIHAEHVRDSLLGTAGFAIGVAIIMSQHGVAVHPGSIQAALAAVRH